jgi:DICT domain-containing protein
MANVSVFDVSGGSVCKMVNSAVGKDGRMALRVSNGNAATAVAVCLKKGDGPRAVLGDKSVTINAVQTAYIALYDTARFKRFSDGAVAVELTAADGSVLTVDELANIAIEAVQL